MLPLMLGALAVQTGMGMYGSYQRRKAERDAINAQRQAGQEALQQALAGNENLRGFYRDSASTFSADEANYRNRLAQELPKYQQFQYDKNVNQFLDPSMAYQQAQMQRSLDQSASTGGSLLSGAAMKALQKNSSDLAQTDWGNAWNRMQQDRGNLENDWVRKFQSDLQNTKDLTENFGQIYNMSKSAHDMMASLDDRDMQAKLQNTLKMGDLSAQNLQSGGNLVGSMWDKAGNLLGGGMSMTSGYLDKRADQTRFDKWWDDYKNMNSPYTPPTPDQYTPTSEESWDSAWDATTATPDSSGRVLGSFGSTPNNTYTTWDDDVYNNRQLQQVLNYNTPDFVNTYSGLDLTTPPPSNTSTNFTPQQLAQLQAYWTRMK